jgi:phosphoglycerate dehydrogenase-like enzyme
MTIPIWKATSTLDGLINDLTFVNDSSQAQIILIGGKPLDLKQFPNLKGIFKTGVGTDNLPFAEAAQRQIAIGLPSPQTAAIVYEETASFAAHLCLQMLYANPGNLATWTKYPREALSTRRVLVIGTGNIGQRVVAKLKPFVIVDTFDAVVNQPEDLKSLMSQADCVTLHIPLTEATRQFIDGTRLGWMKTGAALVNTARGPVVDESALLTELKAGRLRAAFDVFWQEPYQGTLRELHPSPFYMTPHIASTCSQFLTATAQDFRKFLQEQVQTL